MTDHTEQYRRLYARMSELDLQRVKRQDLADLPRQCFDREVARRALHLTPPSPDEPTRHKDLVCVATFVFPDDAKLARALLESADIPVYLENEHTLAANWMLTNLLGGLHLLVPASCAEEAGEVLRSQVSDEDLAAQAEAEPRPEDA